MGGCTTLENGNILVTNPNTRFYECNGTGTTYQNVSVSTVQSDRLKKCEVLGPFVTASASPATLCAGSTLSLTSAASAPMQSNPSYTYSWTSSPSGFTSSLQNPTVTPATAGTYTYTVAVSSGGCTGTASVHVVVNSPTATASVSIGASPGASICSGTAVTFTATPTNGGTSPTYQWKKGGTSISGATNSTYTSASLASGDVITCTMTSNLDCVSGSPATSNSITMTVTAFPIAEAGTSATYTGTPVIIGDPSSGPGTFSWLPTAGLSSPGIAQPSASPSVTTIYTLTVNNNGCTATDAVTITFGGIGHTISGKTRYAAKANTGNPVPNPPTYNTVIYNIDNVIVILKSNPAGTEVARDTSDVFGNYQFSNIADGNYILSYDRYTADTMQTCNDVNAIDVALVKYFIGADTMTDPSRNFSAKYKRAANVDNNTAINAIDIARIKGKVGSPYNVSKNFPKGNWVAIDTAVTVAGSDMNITLKTICYGDFNASSTKYRDSLVNWSMTKSLSQNIIAVSEDYITTADPDYFEIPLRISTKMNDFSALGLELNYPDQYYQLENAVMQGADKYAGTGKINPTLEEIMAGDDDLLVTDEDGVIRVVYATTDHFDVAANDEVIRLGFRSLQAMNPGTLEFSLSGTGVIADQYGEENEDAYLSMPKIMVQGNKAEAGFEFEGFPNPFTNEVALKYSIPESGNVKLMVYNSIGEVVMEVVNESQAGGKHTVRYSPEGFPAGMYTFKLEYTGYESKCKVLKLIHCPLYK